MKSETATSVIRFSAGDTAAAIAASGVTYVGSPEPGVRHIASILGVARDPAHPSGRTIVVRFEAREVMLTVDDPVEMDEIRREDVVGGGEAVAQFSHGPVMGFARVRGQIVLLLALDKLVNGSQSG